MQPDVEVGSFQVEGKQSALNQERRPQEPLLTVFLSAVVSTRRARGAHAPVRRLLENIALSWRLTWQLLGCWHFMCQQPCKVWLWMPLQMPHL